MHSDRLLKTRIYVLIIAAFIVFFTAARVLKPYESQIKEHSDLWVLFGIFVLALVSLFIEYVVYFIFLRKRKVF